MPLKSDPETMHTIYVQLTGLQIAWGASRRYAWEIFCLKFSEDDLRLLVGFLKWKQSKRMPTRSLNFRSLIAGPGSVAYAEEDIAEARATKRIPVVDAGKASVLKSTGRNDSVVATARSAADIIAGEAAFEKFRGLKKEL